ncbi:MAG TPA: HAD-IA family hydrolase [Pseudonocardiaceae bacterium]|jgi:putative hydrolase of the HAD superfamily|nr:HAD-IA family hydrolase [Pseudonocardiaceae bacterium]
MTRPIDAVLCDLDGVLRRWDEIDLDQVHGLPAGTFAETALASKRARAAVTGALTDEQWRAAVEADLARVCGAETARAVVADWTALTGRIDEQVADLLRAVRKTMPVILVSNATIRLDADLAALGIADLADGVVDSSAVGVAKPDPRIYAIAAERAGVPVQRCLFVDDSAANTEGARAIGMIAVHYRELDDLRSVLDHAGLRPTAQ